MSWTLRLIKKEGDKTTLVSFICRRTLQEIQQDLVKLALFGTDLGFDITQVKWDDQFHGRFENDQMILLLVNEKGGYPKNGHEPMDIGEA